MAGGERTFTEAQHFALLTDAVARATASLSSVREDLEHKVTTAETEKAAAMATITERRRGSTFWMRGGLAQTRAATTSRPSSRPPRQTGLRRPLSRPGRAGVCRQGRRLGSPGGVLPSADPAHLLATAGGHPVRVAVRRQHRWSDQAGPRRGPARRARLTETRSRSRSSVPVIGRASMVDQNSDSSVAPGTLDPEAAARLRARGRLRVPLGAKLVRVIDYTDEDDASYIRPTSCGSWAARSASSPSTAACRSSRGR